MKFFLNVFLLNLALINIACTQPISRDLYIESKNEDLCIFTKDKNTFLGQDNSFIVFIGKIEDNQPYNVIYSKEYTNTNFPIKVEDCLAIPVKNLELNKIYEINLESNKNFSQRFCFMVDNNKKKLHLIDNQQICAIQ